MNSSKILGILLLAALAAGICACETEVKFTGQQTSSKPVVSCQISAGKPIDVYISMSIFFLNDDAYYPDQYAKSTFKALDGKIRGVQVSLDGGSSWNVLTQKASPSTGGDDMEKACYKFSTSICPQPGDHVDLKVDIEGYDLITSTTYVPAIPSLEMLDCTAVDEPDTVDYSDYYGANPGDSLVIYHNITYTLTLRMKDDGDTQDWYQLSLTRNLEEGYFTRDFFYSDDVLFRQDMDGVGAIEEAIDDGVGGWYNPLFGDTVISGREHTFKIDIPSYYQQLGSEDPLVFQLSLHHLSPEAYWYITSRELAGDNGGDFGGLVGEAVALYSNMSGGAIGILYSSSVKTLIIDLAEYGVD